MWQMETVVTTGMQWVEDRDVGKHLLFTRKPLKTNYSTQDVSHDMVGKSALGCKLMKSWDLAD